MTTLSFESGALPVAEGAAGWAWLLIALPLLGAALLLLGGRRTNSFGPTLATVLSWGSFGIGVAVILQMLSKGAEERGSHLALWDWVPAGQFQLGAGLQIDQLSITFVMLITFVGSLIHVYSLGYMKDDPSHIRHDAHGRQLTAAEIARENDDRRRFFAYLNLFVASMLLLVLADSFLLLFVGWEGVGLASYLLIGFWNHNPAYASAANKAFFVNRVGDLGLSLAIMAMFVVFGKVDFATVLSSADKASTGWLTAIGLLLLLGACGKSAQFPLQSWLGDAMAGPTPVSALIHAATMVTAGVYLVVRAHPIYEGAPNAQLAVAIVGAVTLLYGAIVGCAKDDIKKALAASTMSQIGYMMLAAGLGPAGYAFAIFHLVTHGFFKAGMFLGAGSVMHGMNDQVDMRRFGHLRTFLKITWATFLCGWLAILGVPPFAGFWSKDKIIETAFAAPGLRGWIFGLATLIGAGITAFYMSRLFFMTFFGKARWREKGRDAQHPHESPLTMTVPMMVLAVGSAFLGLALALLGFASWLHPVFGGEEHAEHTNWPLMGVTLVLVAAGAAYAWQRYGRDPVPVTAPHGSFLTRAARADLFQDDLNEHAFRAPGEKVVAALLRTDDHAVDAMAEGTGSLVQSLSGWARTLQNGYARTYALTMLTGVVAILGTLWVIQ